MDPPQMAECSGWFNVSLSGSVNQMSLLNLLVCQLHANIQLFPVLICNSTPPSFINSFYWDQLKRTDQRKELNLKAFWSTFLNAWLLFWRDIFCAPPPLLPVCHGRALSLTLGQGEAAFSQVELQPTSLHQPVRRLQDLRGQSLRLRPLVWTLAAPGSRLGHDAPRGGRRLWLLADAIKVLHRVFASFASSGTTTAGKHCYLQSSAACWWKIVTPFPSVAPATSTLGEKLLLS